MVIRYSLLIIIMSLNSMVYSFNFDGPIYPYIFLEEQCLMEHDNFQKLTIEDKLLRYSINALKEYWFWQNDFFGQSRSVLSDRHKIDSAKICVAILDTKSPWKNFSSQDYNKESFNLSERLDFGLKIKPLAPGALSELSLGELRNLLTPMMKKKSFVDKLLQKNHGTISSYLIEQIAPGVDIISIPILDDNASCSKQELLYGLQQASHQHVDILHLGLQIYNLDCTVALDQEIIQLLQKFPYVVAAAGNNGAIPVGYPARITNVISVGACQKQDDRYTLASFSQAKSDDKVNFILPGHNIIAPIWIDEIQKYIMVPTAGTSMAAAFMTGVLAMVLEENQRVLSTQQIMQLLYKCSIILDISWYDTVQYGAPILSVLLPEIKRLKKKKHNIKKKLKSFG